VGVEQGGAAGARGHPQSVGGCGSVAVAVAVNQWLWLSGCGSVAVAQWLWLWLCGLVAVAVWLGGGGRVALGVGVAVAVAVNQWLWLLAVAYCLSGSVTQWLSDSVVVAVAQWFCGIASVAAAYCLNGSVAQWLSGSVAQWLQLRGSVAGGCGFVDVAQWLSGWWLWMWMWMWLIAHRPSLMAHRPSLMAHR
jgi:hypothetical protein